MRQLIFVGSVVAVNNLGHGLIGREAGHLLAILLDKEPVCSFPTVSKNLDVFLALIHHYQNSGSQKSGDLNLPVSRITFGTLCDLLTIHIGTRLGHSVRTGFKVDILPFRSQQLALTKAGIDSKEKYTLICSGSNVDRSWSPTR